MIKGYKKIGKTSETIPGVTSFSLEVEVFSPERPKCSLDVFPTSPDDDDDDDAPRLLPGRPLAVRGTLSGLRYAPSLCASGRLGAPFGLRCVGAAARRAVLSRDSPMKLLYLAGLCVFSSTHLPH